MSYRYVLWAIVLSLTIGCADSDDGPVPPLPPEDFPEQEPIPQRKVAGFQFGDPVLAHDFTGDGVLDLVVVESGGSRVGPQYAGAVHVFPADGLGGFYAPRTLTDPDPSELSRFGRSIAAGDVTADGVPDLIVSASHTQVSGVENAGKIVVFPGNGQGGFGTPLTLVNPAPDEVFLFGWPLQVVPLGRPHDDGGEHDKDDTSAVGIVIGAHSIPAESTLQDSGKLFIFQYDGQGFQLLDTLTDPDSVENLWFPYALTVADVTGDEKSDIISSTRGGYGGGKVYIFPQRHGKTFGDPIILRDPMPEREALFGIDVAAADVTGDGLADVIVGASNVTVAGVPQAGAVYVFPAERKGEFGLPVTLTMPTPEAKAGFGLLVAAGDVTGDGISDVIVSAQYALIGETGRVGEVFAFPSNGVGDFDPPFTYTSPNPSHLAFFGRSLAIGEVTGAGHEDLIIGAPGTHSDEANFAGEVYIFANGGPVPTVLTPP